MTMFLYRDYDPNGPAFRCPNCYTRQHLASDGFQFGGFLTLDALRRLFTLVELVFYSYNTETNTTYTYSVVRIDQLCRCGHCYILPH